jgi:hypothetical protein
MFSPSDPENPQEEVSDTPRTDAIQRRHAESGLPAWGSLKEYREHARALEREFADAERRLRRFAGIALAVEGKDSGFGSQLTGDRELGFIREDFLGRLAQGDDAYTAFCYAIDQITDRAK